MEKTSYKAKYIHIIYRNEVKFGTRVVRFLNDLEDFDSSQHLFVTPHKVAYEAVKEYDNVILDEEKTNLINKYAPACNWIICHGHFSAVDLFKIKNKYMGKVIYRYWGGNFGFSYKKGELIRNFIKYFANVELRRRFNKFAAIGIAKNTDVITLNEKLKNNRYYRMPYTGVKSESILESVRDNGYENDGIVNIALYHRGTPEGNHIDILKKLKRFGDKIRVYVPLSYGDKDYIEKVKTYIKETSSENVTIVDEFMEYEDYVTLMNKMDIAIFDCETSTALGNVAVYLFLKKKMILNRNGVIKKAFDEENIPHSFVDELDTISFEELIKKPDYPENVHYDMMPLGLKRSIKAWKEIIEDFN